MSAYRARYAELYDVFYADKPYAQEAEFVHRCLQAHRVGSVQRILELACGTGSHALALGQFGYQIVATDESEDMLSCARRKASQAASQVDFRRQDMRALDLAGERFDATICLFDSIGYVETNEGLVDTLCGVHRHLRPEGLFVFDFWHAAAMLRSYDPVRVRRWAVPEGELLRISETRLEPATQVARVTYTIYNPHPDGTFGCVSETHVNRFFLVQEMAGWLSMCGFTPFRWCAGYGDDEEITEDTWHVVAVARRQGERSG